MKNLSILSVLSVSLLLAACSQNKPVPVAKSQDMTTIAPKKVEQAPVEIPANAPKNATAVCRDGSFSTATENMCSGNGGVVSVIRRYHSE